MKCAYKYCQHGGTVDKADAVKVGTRYFHPDCLRISKAMTKIVELYHEKVDPNPIEAYLRRTINDIVYKDGCDAEYLLFALRYCLSHGWTLHTPSGLRYVAKDGIARKEWNKITAQKTVSEMKKKQSEQDAAPVDLTEKSFSYIPQKAAGFEDILK